MKKRWIPVLAAALLLFTLAACSAPEAPQTTPAPADVPAAEEASAAPDGEEAGSDAKEAVPDGEEAVPDGEEAATENAEMAVHFTTIAFDGTTVNESILSEASVTMINFFEPWCPPCIAELPELQKLYENYADKGFNLIGVYSTVEGTADVLADAGVGYPVLLYVPPFDVYQTGYVPTTVFLDAAGNQLGETVVGSRSYEEWEEIVKGLLG
ncbi:MAG: TlpA family protein disulfide reductase [Oscillospiraceae bacterium]|nr:TlpA family protein disulfide reductase [Oscillospiraceae bacterium]